MGFLDKLFGKKDEPIKSYSDFWNWFLLNEKDFFKVVSSKRSEEIEKSFFNKISPKLAMLKDGYFFLTGMCNDNTAELVLTADGNVTNIVFIEELVNAAPNIAGWKFTALKPAMNIEDVNISMAGYQFNGKNLNFYANDTVKYPDEIAITIVHNDLTAENKNQITNGVYIFLDNYLGELEFASNIDTLRIVGLQEVEKELVPIAKLKDFLIWRQKEFIEKYDGVRYDTENDGHTAFEAEVENGNKLFAIINTDLLGWDSKPSHPWVSILTLRYDGSKSNGMPSEDEYGLLDRIQDEMMTELKDIDGYLNIGRQTANGEREIYFACRDFRKPSKIFHEVQQRYSSNFQIEYDIYKDKYWQSFDRFTS
ncbi:DUF695 domain-containing protein [Nubsella zeaxanthinifaciens]|uniref:DUF695 domain-containing protein n=1 Tax=Nubsella zeaxanthinifaciens TaxID=392412 RepID=UPI003D051898